MTAAASSCPACSTPLPEEARFCLHCGVATPTEPGGLRINPTFAELKGNPRFDRLAAQ